MYHWKLKYSIVINMIYINAIIYLLTGLFINQVDKDILYSHIVNMILNVGYNSTNKQQILKLIEHLIIYDNMTIGSSPWSDLIVCVVSCK